MTRVELAADFEARVARLIARRVGDVADQVAAETRKNAPAAKVWGAVNGEAARPSHRHSHRQRVPANLRFRLPRMMYVPKGRGRPGRRGANQAGGWKVIP